MNPPSALSSNIPTQPINNTNDDMELSFMQDSYVVFHENCGFTTSYGLCKSLSFSLCHEPDYSYWHLYLC